MNIDLVLRYVLILTLGWASGGFAQDLSTMIDRDQPLEISSRQLEVFQQQQRSVFSGDVIARQAQMTLHTEQLTIFFDEQNQLRRIEAHGAVRIEDPLRVATAAHAVFDQQEDTLVLSGDAVVVQGENRIAGDEIILYLGQNRSVVKSTESGRVRAVILPEKKPETP